MVEKERQQRKDPSKGDDDRRRGQRHQAAKLGSVITRVIGGGEVKLLDFSRSGVLIESDTRLTIGQKATIRLTTTDAAVVVRGHVVRSRVSGVNTINGAIKYRAALALDDDLTALEAKANPEAPKQAQKSESKPSARWTVPESVPASEVEPSLATDGADGSEHAYLTDLNTGVGASVDPVLEVLATVPHDLAELRRRAAVNNW